MLKAQSTRDIQGLAVAGLDDPNQNVVAPLAEGHLERAPEELPAERLVGCNVKHAARTLMVVVAHRCDDLTVLVLLGNAAEVFNPDEPRALRDPSVDLTMPED